MILAIGSIAAVVAITVTMVLVNAGSAGAPAAPSSDGPTGAALATTVRELTSLPARVLDAVGGESLATADIGSPTAVGGGYLTPITGSALIAGGKPEVLYVGAEFCTYCAAVRWPLIVALSRFGSFSGLTPARSAVTAGSGQREPYPATPTWTFYRSSYASPYLTFTPVELSTSVPDKTTGGYTPCSRGPPGSRQRWPGKPVKSGPLAELRGPASMDLPVRARKPEAEARGRPGAGSPGRRRC